MRRTSRFLGVLAFGVSGLAAMPSPTSAQEPAPLTLVCEGRDSRTGDEVSARFRVNFRTSEVVYLDHRGRAMWAAPATITSSSIVWYAVDFRQFPDLDALVNDGLTGQLRNFNTWPYGPKGWIIKLKGSIDRATGRIQGLGRTQWEVPRFTNGTFRWADLEAGTCESPPPKAAP